VGAEPVRDDEPIEAPVITQNVTQQLDVVGCICAVEFVVATHHAPGASVEHRCLERPQVKLTQGGVVNLRIHRHAFDLGVVSGEVLHGDRHVVRLHSTHDGCRELRRQFGVFAEALEGSPTDGCAMQVHRRGKHDVHRFASCFAAEQHAEFLGEIAIP